MPKLLKNAANKREKLIFEEIIILSRFNRKICILMYKGT